jgi:hypothetical protein
MRASAWLGAVAVAAGWAAGAFGDVAPDRLESLISRLGSGTYRDREAASHELDALGADALAALRRATASADPETRHRAGELVERIGDRLTAARILAPSTFEFKYENKPLAEAVADFGRRAGASLILSDPTPSKFRERRVTAATPGPIPFWDAVELFCRKADLHEWDGFSRVPGLGSQQQQGAIEILGQGGIQGQVFIARSGRRVNRPAPNAIALLDGPGPALSASRSGAVRIRIPPIGTLIDGVNPVGADEVLLPIQLSAEPKLLWQAATDVRIHRAIDDHGRSLVCTPATHGVSGDEEDLVIINNVLMQAPYRRGGPVAVRVQRGDKPATRLAELAGSIAAQVRVAEPLAVAETPLKAIGQTIHGNAGVTLKVATAAPSEAGAITIGVEIHMPRDVQLTQQGVAAVQFAGQLQLQGGLIRVNRAGGDMPTLPAGATDYMGLALEDAKGQKFTASRGMFEMNRFAMDGSTIQFTTVFKPTEPGQEPARLVFTATRPATIEFPFTVKDIPLQ